MRRRYQVNLYTEHSKHLDLIEHLMSFDKNKRSSELTMLLLAGYQVLYGKGDTGFDKSSSMLIDEHERLLSILTSRMAAPGNQAPQQVPSMPNVQYPADPQVSRNQSDTHHSDNSDNGSIKRSSTPDDGPSNNRNEHKKAVEPAAKDPISAQPATTKSKNEKALTRDHDSNDLADEDPSIDHIPEQDLDEDIVDPLSLLG